MTFFTSPPTPSDPLAQWSYHEMEETKFCSFYKDTRINPDDYKVSVIAPRSGSLTSLFQLVSGKRLQERSWRPGLGLRSELFALQRKDGTWDVLSQETGFSEGKLWRSLTKMPSHLTGISEEQVRNYFQDRIQAQAQEAARKKETLEWEREWKGICRNARKRETAYRKRVFE